MKTIKQQLHEEYEALCTAFGIGSRCWDELHCRYSTYVFCKANRESFIGEYFILKYFTERARKADFVYYQGIDMFLEEYKTAVYSRVNLEDK